MQQTMPTAVFVPSSGTVQLQTAPGFVTVQGSASPSVVDAYHSRQSKRLGITLIIIGALAFIANGVGFPYNDYHAPVGHGFWSGAMFILTGGFGIGAASKQRCMIVTFLILGIFSTITTVVAFFISLSGVLSNVGCSYNIESGEYRCDDKSVTVAVESIICAMSVAGAVVSIWGSAICCRAVCCCAPTYGLVVATASYGNQQMFISQQPGTVQYGNQQVMGAQMSPPGYQPVSSGYSSNQPQYMVSGPYETQYGYNVASAPTPGPSSGDGMGAVTPPPAYTEPNEEKLFKH